MSKIEIFCVTNIPQKKLEALNVTLVGVGKNIFPKKFMPYEIGHISKDKGKVNLSKFLEW